MEDKISLLDHYLYHSTGFCQSNKEDKDIVLTFPNERCHKNMITKLPNRAYLARCALPKVPFGKFQI